MLIRRKRRSLCSEERFGFSCKDENRPLKLETIEARRTPYEFSVDLLDVLIGGGLGTWNACAPCTKKAATEGHF